MRRLLGFASLFLLAGILTPVHLLAWNTPGHMLSGALAYQVLERESSQTIQKIRTILEKHPWYETRWKGQLEKLPETDRDETLFMIAPTWANEIFGDILQHRGRWHHIGSPFKPDGEPEWVHTDTPPAANLVSAITYNERIALSSRHSEKRAIAVTWLFHLIGDIHQPLHTISLFTREYPRGDYNGNNMCVRPSRDRGSLELHEFWDDLVTGSNKPGELRRIGMELRGRFPRIVLAESASLRPEAWARESFEIGRKISYQGGAIRGTPKGRRKGCWEVSDAAVLPDGYAASAREIVDSRIVLAGYRLANLLERLVNPDSPFPLSPWTVARTWLALISNTGLGK
jgi:S1/P1 Nuclease